MLTVSNPCHLQVWLDEDVELYEFAKVRPLIKKKQIMVIKNSLQFKCIYSFIIIFTFTFFFSFSLHRFLLVYQDTNQKHLGNFWPCICMELCSHVCVSSYSQQHGSEHSHYSLIMPVFSQTLLH